MIEISQKQLASLKERFLPDEPGPLVELHVLQTGNGRCWVDRWPDPQAILAETAGNYALSGNADVLSPPMLQNLISGFVATPPAFVPILQATFSELVVWDRLILSQTKSASAADLPAGFQIKRLTTEDMPALAMLGNDVNWVAKTWGGIEGLARSGLGWGAFAENGRLTSIVCTFFLGHRYEEIGIATDPEFRGLGLSTACSAAWCRDVAQRGHRASWTTSPDNIGSLRVAEKLGFTPHHQSHLYVIKTAVPTS